MYLVIDVGNTKIKYFLFSDEKIVQKGNCHLDLSINKIKEICQKNRIDAIIYSNVANNSNNKLKDILKNKLVVEVNSKLKLPFKNKYKTKETLGSDRIGLICAATKKYPRSNVLIIDLGSCITYDFLTSKNIYNGGAITPGFDMRYKCLSAYAGRLPLLEFETPKEYSGNSTSESIHSGIYYGILDEIKGQISYYQKKFSPIKVILTGGDSNKLSKRLKNGIFANSNFMAEGLLYLLKFNISR